MTIINKTIPYNFLTLDFTFFESCKLSRVRYDLFLKAIAQWIRESDLNKLEKHQCQLAIQFVSEDEIQALNHEHRQKDKVTDVLSFGLYDFFNEGIPEFEVLDLGTIFICEEVCLRQAIEFNISPEDEFFHLCSHGFLHLLGFDHEINDLEASRMQAAEDAIIALISELKH